ncbi:DinB family protein [Mesoterricola silvestris]|uniref:DinB family protein n=1 Tax=Mesoterricola silvestris TaxID=2927979 RepID=A0AA48GR66_9BACT|nr:DinB family protein [Mesoterricola silvestris]BDU74624.1 hypothetical protein METEAL_37980 [Mesoterricola silvestris]
MHAHLERLFSHLEWADERLVEALEDAPADVMRLLGHVLGAEKTWLDRIRCGDEAKANPWMDLTLAEAGARARANAEGYREVLKAATASRLAAPVHYRNIKGEEYWTPLQDILLHVATHGVHHRGQIATLLRQAGREPVDVGFITFAREEEDPGQYAYLEVAAADLTEALEGNPYDVTWYLDLETGEVLVDPDGGTNSEDLLPIEPLPSRDRFRIMEEFVENLEDGEPARSLARALRLPKPFRCFRDTLRDFPALEAAWHSVHEAGMRQLAQGWLDENLPGARLL